MTEQYNKPNINDPGAARLVSSDVDVTTDDTIIVIVGGAPTLTLPEANTVPGINLFIKSEVGAGTVSPQPGETLDGAATFTFSIANETLEIVSNGDNWSIIGGSGASSGVTNASNIGVGSGLYAAKAFDEEKAKKAGVELKR